MNKFLEKLHKFSGTAHLSSARKEKIKADILRHIAAGEFAVRPARAAGSPFLRRLWTPALSLAAILIIAVSGTSLAAEYSLPGDFLYPVKIDFNEPLVGALNFAPAMKAAWEVRLAERRMEEVDQLALEGRLNVAAKADLADKVVASADKAQQAIDSLSATDADSAAQVSARLESSIQAHAQILAKLEDANTPAGQALQAKLNLALNQAAATDNETEAKAAAGAQDSAQGKIGAAANVIASLNDYLNAQNSVLGADASASAATRLANAKQALQDAQDKFNSGDYTNAFILARQAMQIAQETRILAEAQVNAAISASAPAAAPGDSEGGQSAAAAAHVNFLAGPDNEGASSSTATSTATSTEATSTDSSGNSSSTLHVDGNTDISP